MIFFSVLHPFQDYFNSYEMGQSVAGAETGVSLEKKTNLVLFQGNILRYPGSEVAEWLAHWLLVLEVTGSIPASGEESLLV